MAVRIGVATGMVMVGEIVGEGMAQERTVIGEAPNMAARLQGVAGRNGMVIGGLTKELTGDTFVYRDAGTHELKGIDGQVQTWGVVGLAMNSATISTITRRMARPTCRNWSAATRKPGSCAGPGPVPGKKGAVRSSRSVARPGSARAC